MSTSISVGESHTIGGDRPFVIAEVAQAHDGSLGLAHAFVDAVARAGADAVKFQTHIAHAESTPQEPWRTRFSPQDDTRYGYWQRMEFTPDQWQGLRDHAVEKGLVFLSSPFSVEAVELLDRVGVPAWKVASGEVAPSPMFDALLKTGKPVLLSTGMSTNPEIDDAVERVRQASNPLVVLQCTTEYPCRPEHWGLNLLEEFRRRYGCPVGFSDHSGTPAACLAAAALGADVLEVHVTFSREMYGPDVPASLRFDELRTLVEGSRAIRLARANPVDKDRMAASLGELRAIFSKSVVARAALPAGTVLREEHLTAKKPGTGIPAGRLRELLGSRLKIDVQPDHILGEEDLEAI